MKLHQMVSIQVCDGGIKEQSRKNVKVLLVVFNQSSGGSSRYSDRDISSFRGNSSEDDDDDILYTQNNIHSE